MSEISKRSMQRYNRLRRIVDSMCGDICYWIGEHAHRAAYTAERVSQYHVDRILNDPRHAKLPAYERGEIEGCWKLVWRKVWQTLVWTHVLDGERLCSKVDESRFEGRWNESVVDDWESAHCWAYRIHRPQGESQIVFVPYSEASRAKEMESGRLTQSLLDDILNWPRREVRVEYLTLGTFQHEGWQTRLVGLPQRG